MRTYGGRWNTAFDPWGLCREEGSSLDRNVREDVLAGTQMDVLPVPSTLGQEVSALFRCVVPPGATLLTIGGGASALAAHLALDGYRVTLLDQSEEALALSKEVFAKAGAEAEWVQGDLLSMGLPDGSFDCVWTAGVLEHVDESDLAAVIQAMARAAAKYVIGLVPNAACLFYRAAKWNLERRKIWPYGRETPMKSMASLFQRAGLQVVGEYHLGADQALSWLGHLETGQGTVELLRAWLTSGDDVTDVIGGMSYLLATIGAVRSRDDALRTRGTSQDDVYHRPLRNETEAYGRSLHGKREPGYGVSEEQADPIARLAELLKIQLERSHEQLRQLNEQVAVLHSDLVQAFRGAPRRVVRQPGALAPVQLRSVERSKTPRRLRLGTRSRSLKRVRRAFEAQRLELMQAREEAAKWRQSNDAAWAELARIYRSRTWRLLAGFWRLRRGLRRGPVWLLQRMVPGVRSRSFPATERDRRAPRLPRGECRAGLPGLVSVVLPHFNDADRLSEAVASVVAQSYENWELIIVDDGSSMDITAIAGKVPKDGRIRLVHQSHQGLPQALSNGFEYARGEFRTWTSSDNRMQPGMLEALVSAIDAQKLDMVYANYAIIGDDGALLRNSSFRIHNQSSRDSSIIVLPTDVSRLRTEKDNFIGPSFLYRAWCGVVLGPYDGEMGVEDYSYWMEMSRWFRVARLSDPTPQYLYRVHRNSLSSQAHRHQIFEKAERLMRIEQARSAFYREPLFALPVGKVEDSVLARFEVVTSAAAWIVKAKRAYVVGHGGVQRLWDCIEELGRAPAVAVLGREDRGVFFRCDSRALDALNLVVSTDAEVTMEAQAVGIPVVQATDVQGAAHAAAAAVQVRLAKDLGPRQERAPAVDVVQDRLRVMLAVPTLGSGGMERVVADLCRALTAMGVKPSVVSKSDGAIGHELRQAGVGCYIAPDVSVLERVVAEVCPHVVNCHYWHDDLEVFGSSGSALVQTVHNTYVWLPADRMAAIAGGARWTHASIAVSRSVAEFAVRRMGLAPNTLTTVPNGIDVEAVQRGFGMYTKREARKKLGLPLDATILLQVASIYPPKGQCIAIDALRASGATCHLVLLGGILDRAYAERLQDSLTHGNLGKRVHLVGFNTNPWCYYRAADAVIAPSLWEGNSLTLIEAACCGLPILATRVGAAEEVIHQHAVGMLVEPVVSPLEIRAETLARDIARSEQGLSERFSQAIRPFLANLSEWQVEQKSRAESAYCAFGMEAVARSYLRVFRTAALDARVRI